MGYQLKIRVATPRIGTYCRVTRDPACFLDEALNHEAARTPNILVVDDDLDIQASLRDLLQDAGYQVICKSNGAEAAAYLRDNPAPACIVFDLWMPVMDGWQFFDKLRGGAGSDIPAVVVTAAESHWGYPIPPKQVLRKPINPNRLLALVASLKTSGPVSAPAPVSAARPK